MSGENPPSGGKSFWGSLPGILTGVAALVTAGGTVLGLVLTRGNPPPPPEQPTSTVTIEPQQDASVPSALGSEPSQFATTAPTEPAPQSGCPSSPGGFWMQFQSVPYGPFGNGYYLAWDAFGFYVWDPQFGWLPYPDPLVRNTWVQLTGSPFIGCVAGGGAPVFGQYVG